MVLASTGHLAMVTTSLQESGHAVLNLLIRVLSKYV